MVNDEQWASMTLSFHLLSRKYGRSSMIIDQTHAAMFAAAITYRD